MVPLGFHIGVCEPLCVQGRRQQFDAGQFRHDGNLADPTIDVDVSIAQIVAVASDLGYQIAL